MSDTDGPMQAAQRLMRPTLPKRFYEKAEAAEIEGGWGVMLDGRPVRTPAKVILSVPRRELAEALAQEWQDQVEVIDPNRMPLTRLVNSALDSVSRELGPVRAEIVKYAGSDLICYRAEGPDRLVAQQAAAWNPVLDWAHDHLGVRFVLAEGVMFVSQPPEALDAVEREVESLDVLRLSALSTAMTLTGSTLISLALLRGRLSLQESWEAAHVDEDWNIELWGADDEAMERRAARFEEMQAAAQLMRLA